MQCERVKLIAEFFPDFAIWLAKAKSPRFLEEAENVLSDCSSHGIQEACRRLLESPPRSSVLPFQVARLARQLDVRAKARRWKAVAGGQDTFACPRCRDSGLVEILHPDVVLELRNGKRTVVPYSAVVLCACPAGDRRAEISAALRLARLDANWHIPLEGRSALEACKELMNDKPQIRT